MYKNDKSFEERYNESKNIIEKYPNRIPVIVEKCKKCKTIKDIDKTKYLVPNDMTLTQFIYVIRKRLKITSEQAIFVFINNKIITSTKLIKDIYNEEKDDDNFLYLNYASENTFG